MEEIGFLGLGIMGKAMSMNLLSHGYKVTVWNRTLSRFLLEGSHNGRMGRGRRIQAITKFKSSGRSISRIWAAAKQQQQQSNEAVSLQNGKKNKRVKRVQIDLDLISSLPLHKRSTIRRLAKGINCSRTTVGRWAKTGKIRAHTSAIRPELTALNKLLRLIFSLEALELDRVLNILRFKSMHNTVHIDEKWFYISKGVHRFYLTPDEIEPHRTCKSKKFITKVMFMCAVCRPIFGQDGSVVFDGKIGMFPFTFREPAKRASKNRPAGTMETKAIDSITKDVVRDCLLHKIIPAIKAKWPTQGDKNVFIQQDNARPHIKDNDPLFREASIDGGLTFTLVQQPPNSPDLNVNDLGFFHSIQALQNESATYTIDGLVKAVQDSFEQLSPTTLNNVFLSLQGCMVEIIKLMGQNSYKVPHMGKEAMIRAGTLPLNLEVDKQLVRQGLMHLLEAGNTSEVEVIKGALGIELPEAEDEEQDV